MTVSERIFGLIKQKGYTQKEFALKTGIAESTISDWKKKGTNPVSDKILMICEVLEVSPYFLLSGAENKGDRSRENQTFVVSKASDQGELVSCFESLDEAGRKDALKYLKKLAGGGKDGGAGKEAGTGTAAKAGGTSKTVDASKAAEKPGTSAKSEDTVKPKTAEKPAVPHLPDIRTIASDEADHLIKPSEDDGGKKKKDKKDKSKDKGKIKDKSKDKDGSKDKSEDKIKDKAKDKGKKKDKKKKKKGYLLDR